LKTNQNVDSNKKKVCLPPLTLPQKHAATDAAHHAQIGTRPITESAGKKRYIRHTRSLISTFRVGGMSRMAF